MENWAKIIFADSRRMSEVKDQEIDLIITSPPYWHIKDYGVTNQIGFGQSLHNYLRDLYYTWSDCFRILRNGSRLCINIGDQFARSIIYGRYKIIPLHAEIIAQCEDIGFDFLGSIIWQKKTTMNTTGGANVMGSYPYPPNGLVEIDFEFILIFKKPGKSKEVPADIKEESKMTKEEWKKYFSGHWYFGGTKQLGHEAMFPDELPQRLIKMFSFKGDTVLDPFLGSGTTVKAALSLERNAIGYEINKKFIDIISNKLEIKNQLNMFRKDISFIYRENHDLNLPSITYIPRIKDANPIMESTEYEARKDKLYKVIEIVDEYSIKIESGKIIRFLGIKVINKEDTIRYLNDYVLGKYVILKFDNNHSLESDNNLGYVYLKNKIFINSYLIKSGMALPDPSISHKYQNKFNKLIKQK